MQAAAVQILPVHRRAVGRWNQLAHAGLHGEIPDGLGEGRPRIVVLTGQLHHDVDGAGLELLVPPLIRSAFAVVTHDDRARPFGEIVRELRKDRGVEAKRLQALERQPEVEEPRVRGIRRERRRDPGRQPAEQGSPRRRGVEVKEQVPEERAAIEVVHDALHVRKIDRDTRGIRHCSLPCGARTVAHSAD